MNFGSFSVSLIAIPIALCISTLSWLLARVARSRRVFFVGAAFACVLGIALAVNTVRLIGYVAPYNFAVAWFFAGIFVVAGAPMLLFHSLRRGGLIAVITGGSFLASFYLVILSAHALGLTSWRR